MRIVLYSRRGCHLCEQVEEMLACHEPAAIVVDVDSTPALTTHYGSRVPVVEVGGVVVIEGRFDEPALRAAIRRGSGPGDGARR